MHILDKLSPLPQDLTKISWKKWYDEIRDHYRSHDRDAVIVSGLVAGHTLQEMGDYFNVTRERIRQIVSRYNISSNTLRKKRKEKEKEWRIHSTQKTIQLSKAHPEYTIEQLSSHLGLTKDFIHKALGARRIIHDESEARTRFYSSLTKQELGEAIKTWFAQSDTHTSEDYDRWSRDHDVPGRQTVMIRFHTWNNALRELGLISPVNNRGGARPRLSDELCWASLYRFFTSEHPYYSIQSYETYAKKNNLPSSATLRKRFGTWSHMKIKVRHLIQYATHRDGSWEEGERILDKIKSNNASEYCVSVERAYQSLKNVAQRFNDPITMTRYNEHRSQGDLPASVITRLCGTWGKAVEGAGLSHRLSAHGKRVHASRK